jgi:hypothetical protein
MRPRFLFEERRGGRASGNLRGHEARRTATMMGLVLGGVFGLVATAIVVILFLRLAWREERENKR